MPASANLLTNSANLRQPPSASALPQPQPTSANTSQPLHREVASKTGSPFVRANLSIEDADLLRTVPVVKQPHPIERCVCDFDGETIHRLNTYLWRLELCCFRPPSWWWERTDAPVELHITVASAPRES